MTTRDTQGLIDTLGIRRERPRRRPSRFEFRARNLTRCLTAFAQPAFVQGEGERAALLAGATEGLRQRVDLRARPLQREGVAQILAQIRQALGGDRFDQDRWRPARPPTGNSGRPRPRGTGTPAALRAIRSVVAYAQDAA